MKDAISTKVPPHGNGMKGTLLATCLAVSVTGFAGIRFPGIGTGQDTTWTRVACTNVLLWAGAATVRCLRLRKQRDEAREQLRFAVHAACGLRHPLTLITAPLGETVKNEHLSETDRANINLALRGAARVSEVSAILVRLATEDLYAVTARVSRCELNNYLMDILCRLKPCARKKGVELCFESSFKGLTAWIDRSKMDIVIRELVTAAIRRARRGSRVQVCTSRNAVRWQVVLSGEWPKSPTSGDEADENSDGLLLARKLARNHAGLLTIDKPSNKGSIIRLSVPIRSTRYRYRPSERKMPSGFPPTSAAPVVPKAANQRAPRILIAENDTELRDFLTQTLSATYRVRGANNGQEVIDALEKGRERPDLVLSEATLPDLNGNQVCHLLKSRADGARIPVIMFTAAATQRQLIRSLRTRADKCLVKPFDMDFLRASIANVLANRPQPLSLPSKEESNISSSLGEVEGAGEPDEAALARRFLRVVTESVRERPAGELSLRSLAEVLHVSRSSLHNKIKAQTGRSPGELVRRIRIGEAARLLREEGRTVGEVAGLLGYNDAKHFAHAFKQYYGMPPGAYTRRKATAP